MKKAALKILTNTRWFYSILLLAIIIQILSLNIFMEPWYDEVVFADISRSVAINNHFLLNILPLSTDNKEIFFYGPIFFWLQAFIIKHVTFSTFLFRLPVYLSGVVSAFILGRFIFLITHNMIFERAFFLLFFSNFIICGSLSCGRMEMIALLFISSSLYFLIKIIIRQSHRIVFIGTLSGILFGFAILTTPRSSFLYLLFVLPLFKIFAQGLKTKNIKSISLPLIHVLLSFVFPYIAWYYPHLGNLYDIFNYITPVAKTQISFSNNHIDINSFTWLIIDALLLMLVIVKKVKLPSYLYGFFFSGLIFIAVVIPWSYHHGLIVPVLILIAVLLTFFTCQATKEFFAANLLLFVFCIQLLFVLAKYAIIWIDSPERNSYALQKTLQKYIPQQANVVGEYNYYYACMNNDYSFRSIEDNTDIATGKPVPVSKKVDYLVSIYHAEYLIVQDNIQQTVQPFIETNKFIKIASIQIPDGNETFWQKNRERFGLPGSSFYNGSIYKRITP
jgi:hypothetical protein